MITSKTFNRSVPASSDTIFELNGNVDGGVLVVIENLNENNTMVYKFQESYDGITWVDKSFALTGGGTGVQFTILPESHHEIKVNYTRQKLKMLASGNLLTQISLTHRSHSTLEGSLVINAS
jgi:hypothetical protein